MLDPNLSSFLSFRTPLLTAALACALVLVGCDDDPVSPGPEPEPDPEVNASFTVTPETPDVGSEVTLDGSSSSGENTGALSFDWTLTTPDGSNAVVDDPSAEVTTFEADVEGTYDVALEVSASGAVDTATDAIEARSSVSIVEISDDIRANRTLFADTLYVVTDEVDLRALLTVEPGTTIEFENDTRFELRSSGGLVADGTESAPILMTGTEETPGWWDGIFARSSENPNNVLNWVTVEYGGGADFTGAAPGNVVVGHGTNSASMSITNSTLRQSGSDGLWVRSNGDLPSFEGNTLTQNEWAPAAVAYNNVHLLDDGSTYTGNNDEYIFARSGDTIENTDVQWDNLDVPYRVGASPVEIQDITLTIAPGTTLEFEEDTGIKIDTGGGLIADGTEGNSILFTGTEETPGWWNGIFVQSRNPDNVLDGATVEYGGGDDFVGAPAGNVIIGSGANEGQMNVTNSLLRASAEYGVWVHRDSDANTNICAANSFESNAEAGCEVN